MNSYEGLIKCKILPPRGLHIPLLPCHVNGKLMFILCRACAETTNCGVCGHTRCERCLTGTWVSVELQKAVAIGYVIVEIYEAWNYDETTVYFVTEPRKFFELISDDTYDVSDVQIINDDCVYVT